MSPRIRALAVLALAVVFPACGPHAVRTVRVRHAAPITPRPTPAPVFEHPLTGVIFTGAQDWQSRPALAAKIENLPAARPQSGLDAADVVYEELAEGGITRFIAVFQSHGAEKVGPVRSARLTDADILGSLGGLFAYAGAVPPVVYAVRSTAGIVDVGIDRATSAYFRDHSRKAPHNLYTSTAALWAGRGGSPPTPQFSFLPQGAAPPAGNPGTDASFSFSAGEQMRYVYDPQSGTYRRFQGSAPHLLEDGVQVAPVNVILQLVSVVPGTTVDVNGQVSPDSRVVGSGDAILLRGGQVFRGRWSKSSATSPTTFADATGAPMLLARGQTWIELLPSSRPPVIA